MNKRLAQFFYDNYPTAKDLISFEDCIKIMEKFYTVYEFNKQGEIEFLAVYMKVNDNSFKDIELLKNKDKRELFIRECLSQNGENRICMYCVGQGVSNILRSLRKLSDGAKAVSWYRNDMNKLHEIKLRRTLCPSH